MLPNANEHQTVEQEREQRLETIFFSVLDALRGVWHTNNAANVLLSLIFYKRVVSLAEEGAIYKIQASFLSFSGLLDCIMFFHNRFPWVMANKVSKCISRLI